MAALASYALLEPATGLLHQRFGRRPVVVTLAGETAPLRALEIGIDCNLSQVSSFSLPSGLRNVYLAMVIRVMVHRRGLGTMGFKEVKLF
jgi:hypothetical protein